jgi:Fur family ferric uptake transcriptional regulator
VAKQTPSSNSSYTERVRQVFTDHLGKHGLRLTGQRTRILEFLLATDQHLTLDEIYGQLRSHGVGRSTVFRTLKMMEDCHLVSHISDPKGTSRYEIHLERPHHDHLICIDCRRIIEVRWPELEKIQTRACRELNFEPAWHRHEIFGHCSNCRKEKA